MPLCVTATYLASWCICPLQSLFFGTVMYVAGLAMLTNFSATKRPKPNLRLTFKPTPFALQSLSSLSGRSFDVHTTRCCTSRHVNLGLKVKYKHVKPSYFITNIEGGMTSSTPQQQNKKKLWKSKHRTSKAFTSPQHRNRPQSPMSSSIYMYNDLQVWLLQFNLGHPNKFWIK